MNQKHTLKGTNTWLLWKHRVQKSNLASVGDPEKKSLSRRETYIKRKSKKKEEKLNTENQDCDQECWMFRDVGEIITDVGSLCHSHTYIVTHKNPNKGLSDILLTFKKYFDFIRYKDISSLLTHLVKHCTNTFK